MRIISKYGVEVRGIERVLPQEKKPPTSREWLDNVWMWLAANCTVSFVFVLNKSYLRILHHRYLLLLWALWDHRYLLSAVRLQS